MNSVLLRTYHRHREDSNGVSPPQQQRHRDHHNTTTSSSSTNTSNITTQRQHALPESISWRVSHGWSLLSQNLEKVGEDCFLRMFDENPELLELFHFGGQSFQHRQHDEHEHDDHHHQQQQHRQLPTALKNHAMIVMETLGQSVSGSTSIENILPRLRAIGRVHRKVGVEDFHYDILLKCLIEAIADELGPEEWDGEMRAAWEVAFRSLTSVIKRPEELFQTEPLEGWGAVNALACAYVSFYTPFRMAGFAARNELVERSFTTLSSIACLCLAIDLLSPYVTTIIRVQSTFLDQSNKGYLRQQFDKCIFPVKLRVTRYLRSLRMERWESWSRMDALILVSFPLQYFFRLYRTTTTATTTISHTNPAGVHWTFLLGLLRLVAASRVVHFIKCAEHNLMLTRRTDVSERSMMRIVKLTLTMAIVIHLSACLWNIVARVELGPNTIDPKPSEFFPRPEFMMGQTGALNGYLHAVHWAWVNLAGIGDCDSVPVTSFECLVTLLVHLWGATLYTIITGNVVSILDSMTKKHHETGTDLAELGSFMRQCRVPPEDQKRILQGYMLQQFVISGGTGYGEDGDWEGDAMLTIPEAVIRLPQHLRGEINIFTRVEAIRRRDPAFAHCTEEFLFAVVGSLNHTQMMLPGDYLVKEDHDIPEQVILIEKGTMEVIEDGKCKRILKRGDVIGKRWILNAAGLSGNQVISFCSKTTMRAHSACTLITGLTDRELIQDLALRYPEDLEIFRLERDRINFARQAREKELDMSMSRKRGARMMTSNSSLSFSQASFDNTDNNDEIE